MKKTVAVALVTLLVIFPALAAGCGTSDGKAGGESEVTGRAGILEVSYLYTLSASSGKFTREAQGEYALKLEGVSKITTRFSERPVREADVMTTASFAADWDNCFADDPPNAALVFADPVRGGEDTAVLTLAVPEYEGNEGTLSFRVTDVPTKKGAEMETWDGIPVAELPESFGAASLLIDAVTGNNPCVYNGFTDNWTSLRTSSLLDPESRLIEVTLIYQGLTYGTVTVGYAEDETISEDFNFNPQHIRDTALIGCVDSSCYEGQVSVFIFGEWLFSGDESGFLGTIANWTLETGN